MDAAITQAAAQQSVGKRDLDPATKASGLTNLLAQVPGTGGLIQEAVQLQAASDAQAAENERMAGYDSSYAPYGNEYGNQYDASRAAAPTAATATKPGFPAPPNIDPQQVIAKIYPLFVFRDKVVRTIAGMYRDLVGVFTAKHILAADVALDKLRHLLILKTFFRHRLQDSRS